MTIQEKLLAQPTTAHIDDPHEGVRRAAWRQQLVSAETGLRMGLRASSSLFAYFFCAGIAVLSAAFAGLAAWEWAILILALGLSLTVEMLHQLIQQVVLELSDRLPRSVKQLVSVGTAAAMVAHITALLVVGCLFWPRLQAVF